MSPPILDIPSHNPIPSIPTHQHMSEGEPMDAYCFKCRAKRWISGAQQITLKNGRLATHGTCPQCGAKVFRIARS